jgi:hypothetical protein
LKISARPQVAERFESAREFWRIIVSRWGACANQACVAQAPKWFFNSIGQDRTLIELLGRRDWRDTTPTPHCFCENQCGGGLLYPFWAVQRRIGRSAHARNNRRIGAAPFTPIRPWARPSTKQVCGPWARHSTSRALSLNPRELALWRWRPRHRRPIAPSTTRSRTSAHCLETCSSRPTPR